MAYLPVDEDEKNQQNGQPQQGAEKVISGESSQIDAGGGASSGAQQPASQGQQGPKATQGSRGWTNLTNYVSANQGQDARMGQAIQSHVAQAGQAAQGTGANYRQTVHSAVDQGTVRDSGVNAQLASDPKKVDRTQFQAQYAGQYAGPNAYNEGSLSEAAAATQQQYKATTGKADQVQDFNGRQAALDSIYGRPSYNAGEKRLDSFLVGGGTEGAAALNDIKTNFGSGSAFAGGWDELLKSVNGDIAAGRAASQKTVDDTRAAYEGARGQVEGSIKKAADRAGTTNSDYDKLYQTLTDTVTNSKDANQRAAAWRQLGVDPDLAGWLRSQGASVQSIVNRAKANNLGDFVSGGVVDNYNALIGLTGDESGYDFSKSGSTGQIADANQSLVDKGKRARDLQSMLNSRLAEHTDEADRIAAAFTSFDPSDLAYASQKLGVDKSVLQQAQQLGVNPLTFFKRGGGSYGVSDVASSAEQEQWNELMSYLGAQGVNVKLGNGGSKYAFDKAGLASAIAAAQASAAKGAAKPAGQTSSSSTSPAVDKSAFKKTNVPVGTYGDAPVYVPNPDAAGLNKAAQKITKPKGKFY